MPRTIRAVTIHRNAASSSTNSSHDLPRTRREDRDDQERGQDEQQVDDPHQRAVDPAAEVAGERADERREPGREQRDEQPMTSDFCIPRSVSA